MGFGLNIASIVCREHARRRIGVLHSFGRQTLFFGPGPAIEAARHFGVLVDPEITALQIETDDVTRAGNGQGYIRDDAFWSLMGIRSAFIDVSDYEGADIVLDLNQPVREHIGACEFIVDGSTIDNVFNPAETLRNVGRLLGPGGRYLGVNVMSNHNTPYMMPTPQWFFDYFVANGWLDCHAYAFAVFADGAVNSFYLDPLQIDRGLPSPGPIIADGHTQLGVLVFAEKGPRSTVDLMPNQQHYRPDGEWPRYDENLAALRAATQHPFFLSSAEQRLAVPQGWRFI